MATLLLILVITYTLLIFYNIATHYDKISKLFIYSFQGIWGIILLITCFRPYNLFLPSPETYIILSANLIFFTIGFNSFKIKYNWRSLDENPVDILNIRIAVKSILENKLFLFTIIFLLLYLIDLLLTFITKIAIYGSLGQLREDFYYDNFYGPYFTYIYMFMLVPLINFLFGFYMTCIFYYRKFIPLLLIGSFMAIYATISGGRLDFVAIFIAFLFFFFAIIRITKIKLIYLSLISISVLTIFSYITNLRGNATGETFIESVDDGADLALRHIVTYTCGSVVAFDQAIKNDYMAQINGPKLGSLSFSSVISLINMVTKRMGLEIDEPISDLVQIKQEQYIPIGSSGDVHNALYTSVLYPYLDFGIIGVGVCSLIIGFIIRKTILMFYKTKSLYLLILLTFLYIQIVESIFDSFGINNPFLIITLISLYYLGVKSHPNTRQLSLLSINNTSQSLHN